MDAPTEKFLPDSNASSPDDNDGDTYTELDLGVWRVLLANELSSGIQGLLTKWRGIRTAWPFILRFGQDIYRLNPGLVCLMVLLKLWAGLEPVLKLYSFTRLLEIIEIGLAERQLETSSIIHALVARLMCTALTAMANWARESILPTFESSVRLHFEDHFIRANLRLDMPTSVVSYRAHLLFIYIGTNNVRVVNSGRIQSSAKTAWPAFSALCDPIQHLFELATQLVFVSRQSGTDSLLIVLVFVRPILSLSNYKTLWMKSYLQFIKNTQFLRLKSLKKMAMPEYRRDVIAGNLVGWMAAEYRRVRNALGSELIQKPWEQYGINRTPMPKLAVAGAGELPVLYWVVNAMLWPGKLSLSSITILYNCSQCLNDSLWALFWDFTEIEKRVSDIKFVYDAPEIRNQIVDGDMAYPPPGLSTSKGLTIELRNVSFAYKVDGQSKQSALEDVSFRIPAGALVVIVGANGSGKSTIIKLLTRVYDVSAGEIRVDGLPIELYRIADLRRTQTVLAQDHNLFPLTLAENIGLGYPEHVDDREMVLQAARDGGAAALLDKLNDGLETNLNSMNKPSGQQLDDEKHPALKYRLSELEKKGSNLSGGENSGFSRTFMRLHTGNIKLLCFDEPSSELDPQGEYELFERLRATADGKTMIFVTHRFGHLTKFADMIICMKEGKVAETGTHKDLMASDGEYAALYNVQAQAFSAEVETQGEQPSQ
ncbi:P-loop containing nucleoside triphosphate hydrolase protein [Mycena crocata]|nr:P-loop containing nucleoside triphosphate hydrolase protein [Mycena crocata]